MARRYFQMLSADRVRRGRHAASRRMFSAENRARKASPSQSAAAIRLPSDAKHSPVDALQKIRSIARPRSSPRRRRPNSTKTVSSASPESVQFARMRIALRGLQHEQPQRAESCAHIGVVCRQSDAAAIRKMICAPNAIVIVAGAGRDTDPATSRATVKGTKVGASRDSPLADDSATNPLLPCAAISGAIALAHPL
jgi:hypothetical protein